MSEVLFSDREYHLIIKLTNHNNNMYTHEEIFVDFNTGFPIVCFRMF